jgi:hypothetical protein
MAQDLDVFKLLKTYANRTASYAVDYRRFALALQRQAETMDRNSKLYKDLTVNPDLVLVPKLSLLAREKKVSLTIVSGHIQTVYLPEQFVETIRHEFRRYEENQDVPFPDEETLKLSIPGHWIRPVSVETDLAALMDSMGVGVVDASGVEALEAEVAPEEDVPLYRFTFPDGVRPMVALADHLPWKILEYAVLKIRNHLRKESNKDYVINKLLYAFPAKEQMVRDSINALLIKPFETIQEFRSHASESSFPLWAYLTMNLKKDFSKKSERTSEDWSILQAVYLCEFFNNYLKGKAQKAAEAELAFKTLEACMKKPPYAYTFDQICDFRDSAAVPLLGKYGKDDLETWMKDKTTHAESGHLPEVVVVTFGSKPTVYIAKDRLLPLSVRLIGEARAEIRPKIVDEWSKAIRGFAKLEEMEEDEAFLKHVLERLALDKPLLLALIEQRLLPLVYAELKGTKDSIPELDGYFYHGELVGADRLLSLDRKELLTDARMLLPLWYSIPLLSAIIAFFKRMGKKKDAKPKGKGEDSTAKKPQEGTAKTLGDRRAEFIAQAQAIERKLVPEGYDLAEYLVELERRWNTLINAKAKADLTEDVNSLVRDYLRGILRTLKPSSLTYERLKTLADNLADSQALIKIKAHSDLVLYVQAYMIKLLKRV